MSFKITIEDRAQPTTGSAVCDIATSPVAAVCDSCTVNAPVALCDSCVLSPPVGPQAASAPLSPLDD